MIIDYINIYDYCIYIDVCIHTYRAYSKFLVDIKHYIHVVFIVAIIIPWEKSRISAGREAVTSILGRRHCKSMESWKQSTSWDLASYGAWQRTPVSHGVELSGGRMLRATEFTYNTLLGSVLNKRFLRA